jgi:RimJ/RimL family protein N-acetyltransferase
MRLEAHFRERSFAKDDWRDELQYAVLEQEWRGPGTEDKDPAN